MPIRFYRINDRRQPDVKFTYSNELATGNWQPDVNSISEDFRQYEVNSKSANGS